jgi:hypothetical protein
MIAKERGNVTPLSRRGGRQGERFRFDTAGFPQSHNEVPSFVHDGILDLFIIVSTLGEDDHVTRIMGTNIIFEV